MYIYEIYVVHLLRTYQKTLQCNMHLTWFEADLSNGVLFNHENNEIEDKNHMN